MLTIGALCDADCAISDPYTFTADKFAQADLVGKFHLIIDAAKFACELFRTPGFPGGDRKQLLRSGEAVLERRLRALGVSRLHGWS